MFVLLRRARASALLALPMLCACLASMPAMAAGARLCTFEGSPSDALDRQVSAAVFGEAGIAITPVTHPIGGRSDDDGLSLSELRRALTRNCDAIAGFPLSSVANAANGGLIFSRGYLKSGYVTVRPGADRPSAPANVVAAVYASPAQLIAVQQPDVKLSLQNTSDLTLDALANGQAERAIVWYPALVAYARAHPGWRFTATLADSPYADWHLVFAFPDKSRSLRGRIDAALARMEADGRLVSLTRGWELPGGNVTGKAAATSSTGSALHGTASIPDPRPGGLGAADWDTVVTGAAGMGRGPMLRVADGGSESSGGSSGSDHDNAGNAGGGTAMPPFSRTQMDHGKGLYAHNCAKCHGVKLQGIVGPALKGPAFAPQGHSPLTLGGIFGFMTTNMPADKPGKLPMQDYADILAFLLSSNGYAPGDAKLTVDIAKTSQAPLIAGNSY